MAGKSFEFKQVIHHPRERVYIALRDEMEQLIPLLPNVDSLKVAERKETAPGRLQIVNHWQGKPTSAPKVVQPFLTPEMNRWTDYADWDDAAHCVHWRFELPQVSNLFTCSGTNYFEEAAEGTLVRLTGTLTIYPERVPGVPKFLAKSIAGPLEGWVLGLVSPNLTELPAAVGKFLDAEKT
jgi:hypothetical protein